jgi:hypothetical protein
MLSRIDDIIYPNRCEVIEIEPSQRYIYPIFKNASGSIKNYAIDQKYKFLLNKQIHKIKTIDVVLRDPLSRFISGINTYVFNTKRDNPELDLNTIIYFAENYLFLNRHYAPQIIWLIHLSKYLNNDTKLYLRGMDAVTEYTPLVHLPPEGKILSDKIINRLKTNIHNQVYLKLDNLLLELVDQKLTFKEILLHIKQQDMVAYSKLSCIAPD